MKAKSLTKLNDKGIPTLKNPLHIERAIALLYEYEKLSTIDGILDMQITIDNLRRRIKRLEDF